MGGYIISIENCILLAIESVRTTLSILFKYFMYKHDDNNIKS